MSINAGSQSGATLFTVLATVYGVLWGISAQTRQQRLLASDHHINH